MIFGPRISLEDNLSSSSPVQGESANKMEGILYSGLLLILSSTTICGMEENMFETDLNKLSTQDLTKLFKEVAVDISNFLNQSKRLIEEVKKEESKFLSYIQKEDVYLHWKEITQQGYCVDINFNMSELNSSFKFELMTLAMPLKDIIIDIQELTTDAKLKLQAAMAEAYTIRTQCKIRSDNCNNEARRLLDKTLITSFCSLSGSCNTSKNSENRSYKKIEKRNSLWQTETFVCSNGTKIPVRWHCDGAPDCADGSDERNCENACNEFERRCKNGKCTWSFRFCDGKDDCGDGSDEEDCSKITTISERTTRSINAFLCRNGKQIHENQLCDSVDDCGDNSDEECPSLTSTTTELPPSCRQNEFQCSNGGKCVDRNVVCDGRHDCEDGSDEICQDSRNRSSPCSFEEGYFSCDRCIDLQKVCNGVKDCADGSDEAWNCFEPLKCTPNCSKLGGVCFKHPSRPLCLRFCPDNYSNINGVCTLSTKSIVPNSAVLLMEKATLAASNLISGFQILKFQTREVFNKLKRDLNNCANRPKYYPSILNL